MKTDAQSYVLRRDRALAQRIRAVALLLAGFALPSSIVAGAAGQAPENPMYAYPRKAELVPYTQARLDAPSRAVLDTLAKASSGPPPWTLPPKQFRENIAAFYASLNLPPQNVASRENRRIPGPNGEIPISIFRSRAPAKGPRPVLVYYHGGGMMVSSTDTYDPMLQILTAESGATIVSVDYRLAPEHRFPEGVDDAYTALVWVRDHAREIGVDPGRLGVGGDSAGGYLTAVVTQMARDRGGPALKYQVMIYPAVGTRGHSRTVDLYSQGYFFSREELGWTYAQYLEDAAQFTDPRVQPILAKDFSRLPPALVVLAEYDILTDDAKEYANLMIKAGVPAEVKVYDGTIHAFLNMGRVVPSGRKAMSDIARKLKGNL